MLRSCVLLFLKLFQFFLILFLSFGVIPFNSLIWSNDENICK